MVLDVTLFTISIVLVIMVFVPFFIRWGMPIGSDLQGIFKPAATALLQGKSPYSIPYFTNPPWVLLFYLPFLVIPYPFDIILFTIIGLTVYGFTAHKLGANLLTIILLLMIPQLLWGIAYGNIDWLIALGFILPPQIGLFLVILKPQVGIFVAMLWVYEAWQKGNLREFFKTVWPVVIVCILSLIAFPDMLERMLWYATPFKGNLSLFPYSIPVGIIIVYRMLKNQSKKLAILASPFFTPYLGVNSLSIPILGLLPNQTETIIAVFSLWIMWLIRGTI